MRKALNENPMVQIAVVGVLIAVVGFIFMMNMGGGGGGGDSAPPPTASTPTPSGAGPTSSAPPSGATATVPVASTVPLGPEPPAAVKRAYRRGDVIALLVVEEGAIEDRFVERAVRTLRGENGVSVFIVPVEKVARYAHLTQGVAVSRAPALVVVRPRQLSEAEGRPTAQVHYGFRGIDTVKQAIRDATYEGQPASYSPD